MTQHATGRKDDLFHLMCRGHPWENVTEGFSALDLMDLTPIAFSMLDPWMVQRYPYPDPQKNQVPPTLFPLFCSTEWTYTPPCGLLHISFAVLRLSCGDTGGGENQ